MASAADASLNEQTLAYYAKHAGAYAQSTAGVEMSATHRLLLDRLPAGAHILDAGCGSGRDARAFLDAGYTVSAFDGCAEMAEQASARLMQCVQVMRFQDLGFEHAVFDGIWANASLLHLERAELIDAVRRLLAGLKPTGTLYMSFKMGEGERVDAAGRFFNDMTLHRAIPVLAAAGGALVHYEIVADQMGRTDTWLVLLARRKASHSV